MFLTLLTSLLPPFATTLTHSGRRLLVVQTTVCSGAAGDSGPTLEPPPPLFAIDTTGAGPGSGVGRGAGAAVVSAGFLPPLPHLLVALLSDRTFRVWDLGSDGQGSNGPPLRHRSAALCAADLVRAGVGQRQGQRAERHEIQRTRTKGARAEGRAKQNSRARVVVKKNRRRAKPYFAATADNDLTHCFNAPR